MHARNSKIQPFNGGRLKSGLVLGAAVLLLTTACGKDDDNSAESEPSASISASPSPSDTPSATASPSATATETPSASASPSSTETPSASPTGDSDTVEITINLVDGKPDKMPEPIVEVEQGQNVKLTVASDQAHEIHNHLNDQTLDIPAGGEKTMEFEADKTGTWEVEVEDTGFKLFDLRVQ